MNYGPGKIVGIVAVIGLAAIFAALVYMREIAPPPRPPEAHYDQVFKYCTDNFDGGGDELASVRGTDHYRRIAALPPGEYETGDGGFVYIFGAGMFQIALPPQLQVVRHLGGDVKTLGPEDPKLRPRNVIGCTTEQLTRALEVYGLEPARRIAESAPAGIPH